MKKTNHLRTALFAAFLLGLLAILLGSVRPAGAQTGGDLPAARSRLANDNLDLSWNALAAGGQMTGAGYTLESAIGQPAAGENHASPHQLCSGFICGVDVRAYRYLPLVLKK